VSKINSRFLISSGEKSRVPLGMDGLPDIKTKDKRQKIKDKSKKKGDRSYNSIIGSRYYSVSTGSAVFITLFNIFQEQTSDQ
jgi:hypothetical protein